VVGSDTGTGGSDGPPPGKTGGTKGVGPDAGSVGALKTPGVGPPGPAGPPPTATGGLNGVGSSRGI
jgi:hypothetical protein